MANTTPTYELFHCVFTNEDAPVVVQYGHNSMDALSVGYSRVSELFQGFGVEDYLKVYSTLIHEPDIIDWDTIVGDDSRPKIHAAFYTRLNNGRERSLVVMGILAKDQEALDELFYMSRKQPERCKSDITKAKSIAGIIMDVLPDVKLMIEREAKVKEPTPKNHETTDTVVIPILDGMVTVMDTPNTLGDEVISIKPTGFDKITDLARGLGDAIGYRSLIEEGAFLILNLTDVFERNPEVFKPLGVSTGGGNVVAFITGDRGRLVVFVCHDDSPTVLNTSWVEGNFPEVKVSDMVELEKTAFYAMGFFLTTLTEVVKKRHHVSGGAVDKKAANACKKNVHQRFGWPYPTTNQEGLRMASGWGSDLPGLGDTEIEEWVTFHDLVKVVKMPNTLNTPEVVNPFQFPELAQMGYHLANMGNFRDAGEDDTYLVLNIESQLNLDPIVSSFLNDVAPYRVLGFLVNGKKDLVLMAFRRQGSEVNTDERIREAFKFIDIPETSGEENATFLKLGNFLLTLEDHFNKLYNVMIKKTTMDKEDIEWHVQELSLDVLVGEKEEFSLIEDPLFGSLLLQVLGTLGIIPNTTTNMSIVCGDVNHLVVWLTDNLADWERVYVISAQGFDDQQRGKAQSFGRAIKETFRVNVSWSPHKQNMFVNLVGVLKMMGQETYVKETIKRLENKAEQSNTSGTLAENQKDTTNETNEEETMQQANQTAPQAVLDVFNIKTKAFGSLPAGTIVDKKYYGPARRDIVSFLTALGIEDIKEDLSNVNLLVSEPEPNRQASWAHVHIPGKMVSVIRTGHDEIVSFTIPVGVMQPNNSTVPPWMAGSQYGVPQHGEHYGPGHSDYLKARELAELIRQGLAYISTDGEGSEHPLI